MDPEIIIDGQSYKITKKNNPELYKRIVRHHALHSTIVTLHIIGEDLITVKVNASDDLFLQLVGVTASNFVSGGKFAFEGHTIQPGDTVISLDIESGDYIDFIGCR